MAVENRTTPDQVHPVKGVLDPEWAWAAYKPDEQRPWNLARAGHLYRRAAFGANWTQLQQALTDGPQKSVESLLHPQADVEAFNHLYDEHENVAGGSLDGLQAWWLRRMIETPHPLLEKMTLFWHGYFATNGSEVKDARLMRTHVQLLRTHALRSFADLLEGVFHNPAVLRWLGADANRKSNPNDRFVRSLMDVFTVGPLGRSEEDIQEAARAFTGWFVLRGRLRFLPHEHDTGLKSLFGRQGNFTEKDVLRILLEQPTTAETIVRRLYRWLISEDEQPSADVIAPVVESFARDYDIALVVGTMLRSNLFFSRVAYRQRIKSPVEYALGIIRGLEGIVSTTQLAEDLTRLGQSLYCPPTVDGWLGGRYWINSATLVRRHNLSVRLLTRDGPYSEKLDPSSVAGKYGHSGPQGAAQFLLGLFLQGDLKPGDSGILSRMISPIDGTSDLDAAVRHFAHVVTTQPEFNLA